VSTRRKHFDKYLKLLMSSDEKGAEGIEADEAAAR
jgi:hypothetical protein